MHLVIDLPREEEAEFEAWAAQQGETVQKSARALSAALSTRPAWDRFASLFLRAVSLTQPILKEATESQLSPEQYVLTLLKTMTALYHVHEADSANESELSRRTALEDAISLYDHRVVSLGTAAHIANVSVSEIIDALGKAEISVMRYSPEEVWREVAEAQGG